MQQWLHKTFRILNWLPGYDLQKFKSDLKAGLTTGSMLIAQGMAYAVIMGMPPIYGLYAGVFPLVVYPLLGTSRHLSVGPVAVDMLIVSAGVSAFAASNTSEYISLVILLTAMTGLIELLLGSFRLGSVFKVFSRPVITGFVNAAPIIIGFTQLGHLLGLQLPDSQHVVSIAIDVIQHFHSIHLPTLFCGLAAVTVLVLLKYGAPKLPAAVLVLGAAIAAAWGLGIEQTNIQIVGDIPHGLPSLALPELNLQDMRRLLPTAFTLAMVEFMSLASLSKAFAKRHNYRVDPNHELVALGASNFMGSLFSTLPVSASFSRSAAAEQAGGATALINWVTAAVILTAVLLLTGVFYFLPMSVLAAIIIVAVAGLIDMAEIKSIFESQTQDGIIAIFTFLCTLFIGIIQGILLGIGASLLVLLYQYSRPDAVEVGMVPGSEKPRNIDHFSDARRIKGILILRIDAAFSFMNADFLQDFILDKINAQSENTNFVILDGNSINAIDTTASDALQSTVQAMLKKQVDLYIGGLNQPVMESIKKDGFADFLGEDHFFKTVAAAVDAAKKKTGADETHDSITPANK